MNNVNIKEILAGKFIALDGPDGCGKSSHAKLLAQWLKKQSVNTQIFRDPGDTQIGEKIREILLNPQHIAMSTRTELLLYMAARSQLWKEKIAPALDAKHCVVMDRWLSSTCAYQGYAGDFGIDNVIELAANCLEKVWPELTIICDIDIETASKRLKTIPDRMEQKGQDYHNKVREGFLKLARLQKDFVVIQTDSDMETVHEKIIDSVKKHFNC